MTLNEFAAAAISPDVQQYAVRPPGEAQPHWLLLPATSETYKRQLIAFFEFEDGTAYQVTIERSELCQAT